MTDRSDNDSTFAGSIPQIYDQYLVPLIFEPYAIDLATRVARLAQGSKISGTRYVS